MYKSQLNGIKLSIAEFLQHCKAQSSEHSLYGRQYFALIQEKIFHPPITLVRLLRKARPSVGKILQIPVVLFQPVV